MNLRKYYYRLKKNTVKRFATIAILSVFCISASLCDIGVKANNHKRTLSGAYLSALHAQTNNDPVLASKFFKEVQTLDPNNNNILFQLFFQNVQAGSIEESEEAANKIIESRPNLALAPLVLAVIKHKRGEFFSSEKIIEQISSNSILGISLPLIKAWIKAPLNNETETLALISPYKERPELLAISNLMHGLIYEFYGNKKSALIYYQNVAQSIENQPLYFLKIVTNAMHRLGNSHEVDEIISRYKEKRNKSEMLNIYLKKYRNPQQKINEINAQTGLAEALRFTMYIQLSAKRRPMTGVMASIYGNLALYLEPSLDLLRKDLSDILIQRKQYKLANELLDQITPKQAGYSLARLRIAENLSNQNQTEKAIKVLLALAEEYPSLPSPYITIGDILRSENRFEEAVKFYDKAFSKYPKGKPYNWSLYYTRGIALERSKNWGRAESDFKNALDLSPEEPQVLNYLGYSWLEQGKNIIKAREMVNLAAQKQPEDGYIADSLGWAMFLMGEYNSAVEQLERAVSIVPSDPTINEHLGDAYWKIGRKLEARFQWRHALSINPDFEREAIILDKIDNGLVD